MSRPKKKKKQNRILSNRHGIMLIALLAVVILMVNLMTFSYSWFTPQVQTGKGIYFTHTTNLRSEDCSFETYQGTVSTSTDNGLYIGEVVYNTAQVTGNVSIPANSKVYFRTNIQNNSTQYPSIVSLYIASMPANLTVAVTYPSNSVRSITSAQSDYYIIRNAYVKVKDLNDADGPGLLVVDWYVENTTGSPITLHLGTPGSDVGLYLMYN